MLFIATVHAMSDMRDISSARPATEAIETLSEFRFGQIDAQLKLLNEKFEASQARQIENHTSLKLIEQSLRDAKPPGKSEACGYHLEHVNNLGARLSTFETESKVKYDALTTQMAGIEKLITTKMAWLGGVLGTLQVAMTFGPTIIKALETAHKTITP